MKRITRSFFNRSAIKVAQDLLGCFLTRKIGRKKIIGKIVETEAYEGFSDLASHASRGKTKRNFVMFGRPGHAYIYLIYGMYNCFNIVTGKINYPAAVLIRAVEVEGEDSRMAAGPGKLCRYFKIDKKLNNLDLIKSPRLFLCYSDIYQCNKGNERIVAAKRIGVDYAGLYKDKKWRFYLKNSPAVSKK